MTSRYFAVSVIDANQSPLSGWTAVVTDPGSMAPKPFPVLISETSGSGKVYQVFDMGTLPSVQVAISHPLYPSRTFNVTVDASSGNLSTRARSVYFGLYTPTTGGSSIMPSMEIPLLRVAAAPMQRLAVPGPAGTAPTVLDDPRGIWLNPSGLVVGLADNALSAYPVVVNPVLSQDAAKNDWGRFNSTPRTVDPRAPDGGNWFAWLEYGGIDAKWVIAVWIIGRAGAKPVPNSTDVLVFYSPNTGIPLYGPKDVYPYKRKFWRTSDKDPFVLLQPYMNLAYSYLSAGGTSGTNARDAGLAYQALATQRALVLIMPLQFYGFWGPILAQDGLMRLINEVLLFVGDNTANAAPPSSTFGQYAAPQIGRTAIAGYSAGMSDVRLLVKMPSYIQLAATYEALASKAKGNDRANYSDQAQRLRALSPVLWSSPAQALIKSHREIYSIDGFFDKDNKGFQDEMGDWFTRTDNAILRIYATDGRFQESQVITGTKLEEVFRGVKPQVTGAAPAISKEFHRADSRASFAWFTEAFMSFKGVPFMPETDAHHTIPRVVLSHALALSRFASP
ncbi:MAG: hypothetical protein JO299_02905 [Gammaproteobacteria bacterium]|nr:hypothetical protein [Gammaproteobacteria bacterium]